MRILKILQVNFRKSNLNIHRENLSFKAYRILLCSLTLHAISHSVSLCTSNIIVVLQN